MDITPMLQDIFDTVYSTDLVYVEDCWKRCGDAHCCSFQRYKSRYRILARTPFQELPLLPGEWHYLQSRGWASQFEPCEHRTQVFEVDGRMLRHETVVSRRAGCACDHATRPTICRLYPLLPRFAPDGLLEGVEDAGIYEEMERIGALAPACQLRELPFDQLTPFLRLCAALARSPLLRFHLEAYRLAKRHVAATLQRRVADSGKDVFQVFEMGMLRQTLADGPVLRAEITALMRDFDARWPGWDATIRTPVAEARANAPA